MRDSIARKNQRRWEWAVEKKAGCTVPWLDLDRSMLRDYTAGKRGVPGHVRENMYPASVLEGLEGKDVLCLASGGGQQSAVFALLGARVTVLDLTEGQLEGDRSAARHYGYEVRTVQGDMRDLSCLNAESFDLVFQGNCMAWVPDVREVCSGVARVLRPRAAYRVDFSNPATEFVEISSWDGESYRISVPYAETRMIERVGEEAKESIQFRHHMADIFGGLIDAGFTILQVQDSPHYFADNSSAQPGSWRHSMNYLGGFAVVARRTERR